MAGANGDRDPPIQLDAKVLIEVNGRPRERTVSYVISALKAAARNINGACVVIGIYNDHGEMVGMDVSGVPSEDLQEQIDILVAGEDGEESP